MSDGGCWYVLDEPSNATVTYKAAPGAYQNTQTVNANYDFLSCSNGNFPAYTIYAPNGGNTWKQGDDNVEYWYWSASFGSFKYYQTISGLPNGKYTLTASMYNSTNGESGASFDASGQAGAYLTSGDNSYWTLVTADSETLTTYSTTAYVTNNTAEVGIGNSTTMTAAGLSATT